MILTTTEIIFIALVIILIGVIGNIAGFGGGVILVPLLSLLFNIPLKIVIGSTLAALALPTFIGFLGAWKRDEVDFRLGLSLEIPTIIGVVIGTKFTTILSDYILELIFGVIAFTLSLFMFRNAMISDNPRAIEQEEDLWSNMTEIPPVYTIEKENYTYQLSIPLVLFAGFTIGILAGLLGVGGGWIKNPLLILGFGLPPVIGSGTALFMLAITSVSGGLSHFLAGNFNLILYLTITLSMTIGAIIGNWLKTRITADQISYLVSTILSLVGIIMITKGLSQLEYILTII